MDLAFALLVFSSLLAIVNPLSAVPMYLAMTAGYTNERRASTLRTAIATSIAVLFAFGLLGTWILNFFGITTTAFRITGGLLFLGIGWEMLGAERERDKPTAEEEAETVASESDIGIIPLGLPTLAGPGAITTVITLGAQADDLWHQASVYVAILGVMLVSWAVLALAPTLFKRFGRTGLNVMTRIMGLLVMVVGTQFVIDGIKAVVGELRR